MAAARDPALDGEKVMGLECVIGYLHRGVEKMPSTALTRCSILRSTAWITSPAVSNGLGYCEAVEKLLSVEARPARNTFA